MVAFKLKKNQKLRKHGNGAGVPAEQPQAAEELHGAGVALPQVAVPVKQISVEKTTGLDKKDLNLFNGRKSR